MKEQTHYDVIIIGGSYSGLSAAMALGRSLRKVLVIDSGKPCNAQTPHSHNFLTQDGQTPAAITAAAKEQVVAYDTVTMLEGVAVKGQQVDRGFEIETDAGENFSSRKIIFAAGIKDNLPGIQGFKECWGISLIHCPYCHGYEVRNANTAIVGNGDAGFELARMIWQWTKQLTVLTNGKSSFTEEQTQLLSQHSIRVIEKEIAELQHERGQIAKVGFKDGSILQVTAVYFRAPFEQHCAIPLQIGCELTEMGHIKTDPMQRTNIPGVYAVGDSVSPMRSVANAVYTGSFAGAAVNREMIEEDFTNRSKD